MHDFCNFVFISKLILNIIMLFYSLQNKCFRLHILYFRAYKIIIGFPEVKTRNLFSYIKVAEVTL